MIKTDRPLTAATASENKSTTCRESQSRDSGFLIISPKRCHNYCVQFSRATPRAVASAPASAARPDIMRGKKGYMQRIDLPSEATHDALTVAGVTCARHKRQARYARFCHGGNNASTISSPPVFIAFGSKPGSMLARADIRQTSQAPAAIPRRWCDYVYIPSLDSRAAAHILPTAGLVEGKRDADEPAGPPGFASAAVWEPDSARYAASAKSSRLDRTGSSYCSHSSDRQHHFTGHETASGFRRGHAIEVILP